MIQKKAKPVKEEEGGEEGNVTKPVKDPTWEYYYEGFMMDLLHEIEKRYEKRFRKKVSRVQDYNINWNFPLCLILRLLVGLDTGAFPKQELELRRRKPR